MKLIPTAAEARANSDKLNQKELGANVDMVLDLVDQGIANNPNYELFIAIHGDINPNAAKLARDELHRLGYSTELSRTSLRIMWHNSHSSHPNN